MFSQLNLVVCLDNHCTCVYTLQAMKIVIPVYLLAKFGTS